MAGSEQEGENNCSIINPRLEYGMLRKPGQGPIGLQDFRR